jgi:hypothetical protein
MAYLLLFAGLAIALLAARMLAKKQQKNSSFDEVYRVAVDRPLNRELVALYELQESVESALADLEEKTQVFSYLAGRLEKQRETVDFRLQQMERLITRAEAVLNSPHGNRASEQPWRERHEQVYHHFDQGMTVTDVATELGIGRGEVELILGLRK